MATGLAHIKDDQIHESVLNNICNSFSVSELKIDYCVDLAIPQVTFTVFLKGIKIGEGTINPQHPCVTIGGGVFGFKAEVTICLDPAKKQVTYEIELCVPFLPCKDFKGVLFSW